jgi:hypothetical protein
LALLTLLTCAAGAPLAAESLGANGERIDPMVVRSTHLGEPGPGETVTSGLTVPKVALMARCADEDGCAIRLTSDAAYRTISFSFHLVIDSATESWRSAFERTSFAGQNGDSTPSEAAWGGTDDDNQSCALTDDGLDLGLDPPVEDWGLLLFHKAGHGDELTCVLRVDD